MERIFAPCFLKMRPSQIRWAPEQYIFLSRDMFAFPLSVVNEVKATSVTLDFRTGDISSLSISSKCLFSKQGPITKSNHATLGHWYSTARVSKRQSHWSAACLRARYCTSLAWSDLELSL